MRVLVTGSTGYIGSRLVPRLLEDGHDVVAASRRGSVENLPWADQVEVVAFDVEQEDTIAAAVRGIDTVVYLVHSMDSDEDFVTKDREAARAVGAAAADAAVGRIVYLSGIVPDGDLSDHLRSRLQVEQELEASGVPTTTLRAAMIIGAGSTSFELLRRMSDRVPVVPVPSWMRSRVQPIAISDVLSMLVGALRVPAQTRAYDVGGPDVLTYPQLLAAYAEAADLRRPQITVPWAPKTWVGTVVSWISGMDRDEVVALVESLSHDMVCHEDDARRALLPPGHRLVPVTVALDRALSPADDAVTGGDRGTPGRPAPTDG